MVDGGVLAKLNAHYKFPTWNGQAEGWKVFVRDWEGACKVHSGTVGAPFLKALIFLESVPPKYQQLFRAMMHEGNWGFEEMWRHVEEYVGRNLPLMKEVEAWEALKPKGRSLEDYLDWYREFVRMGNGLKEGAVTEFHWMAAYRKGLMWKSQFEREFIKLKDKEKQEGRELDLDECNAFVLQELRSRLEVQQYKALYESKPEYPPATRRGFGAYEGGYVRTMGGIPRCEHCRRLGHSKDSCWVLLPHLRPSRSPETAAPMTKGGRGVQSSTDPPKLYRPPRSFSAPPPQSRGDDKFKGKSDGKGKSKGKGDGKGKGKGKGDGKGKGKSKGGWERREFITREQRAVDIVTPPGTRGVRGPYVTRWPL